MQYEYFDMQPLSVCVTCKLSSKGTYSFSERGIVFVCLLGLSLFLVFENPWEKKILNLKSVVRDFM